MNAEISLKSRTRNEFINITGEVQNVVNRSGVKDGVCVLFVLIFSVAAFERNILWRDEFTLWIDAAGKSPFAVRPNNNIGREFDRMERYGEAIHYYKRAVEADPHYQEPHYNLGMAYIGAGLREEAVRELEEFLRIDGTLKSGKFSGLLISEIYGKENYSNYVVRANSELGVCYALKGDYSKAIDHLLEGLRLAPDETVIRFNIALTYKMAGRRNDAIREFEEVLRRDPSDEGARQYLLELKRELVK